jgi:hypothetical protein
MINRRMKTHESAEIAKTTLTDEQARALEALRVRYFEDRDLFDPRERTRLRFLRWLVRTERLAPLA